MSRLRLCTYREMRKVVEALGYSWARQRGSHNRFENGEGGFVSLPDYGSSVYGRDLVRRLLQQLNISPERYEDLLDE